MIKSFRHKGLENLYHTGHTKGVSFEFRRKIFYILKQLEAANNVHKLKYCQRSLHRLKTASNNCWAIHVSGNWRITFRWYDGNAYEVDFVDYHGKALPLQKRRN